MYTFSLFLLCELTDIFCEHEVSKALRPVFGVFEGYDYSLNDNAQKPLNMHTRTTDYVPAKVAILPHYSLANQRFLHSLILIGERQFRLGILG